LSCYCGPGKPSAVRLQSTCSLPAASPPRAVAGRWDLTTWDTTPVPPPLVPIFCIVRVLFWFVSDSTGAPPHPCCCALIDSVHSLAAAGMPSDAAALCQRHNTRTHGVLRIHRQRMAHGERSSSRVDEFKDVACSVSCRPLLGCCIPCLRPSSAAVRCR
jgi:hypothetical protein